MAKQYYADNVDLTGTSFPTVGENIRRGNKVLNSHSVQTSIGNMTQTDKNKTAQQLGVSASDLKLAIKDLLKGEATFHFGGLDEDGFTEQELKEIATALNSKLGV